MFKKILIANRTAKIEVRAPGGIERSVGKARRIVDTRKSPLPT